MSSTTISSIPEELRQEITSHLNYADAWSLKQTSKLFYRVVEIPTIKSFLAYPYGPSLDMLEEWEIIPLGYETCHYCNRLLPNERFSRFQRHLTAARQHSLCYDYATWNPKKHYCLDCGIMNHQYTLGQKIYTGFGDPGYKSEALMPCKHCSILFELHPWSLIICPECIELYDPRLLSLNLHPKLAAVSNGNGAEEFTEPEYRYYEDAEPGSLLALIGERLLS